MRMLLIDDNELSGLIESSILSAFGICDYTKDGVEGLNMYSKSRLLKPYDVIFLDIIMPKYSGYQILDMIRSYEKANNVENSVHIVIVSDLNDRESQEQAFRLGANGYINKPLSRLTIKKYIEEHNLK